MVPEYKCVFAETRFALEFEVIDPNATVAVKVELACSMPDGPEQAFKA